MARGVSHLLVCGVTTECCVTTTVREANDRGFQACVLADCTGGFDAAFVRASLDMVTAFDGLFGFTALSAELLEAADAFGSGGLQQMPPARSDDDQGFSVSMLAASYKQRLLTPKATVEVAYARIEEYSKKDPSVWIYLRPKQIVMQEAQVLESKYSGLETLHLPPLYGIPFAVKDSFDVEGIETTAGCPAYSYVATSTSPLIASLLKAGALLLGKTNMDQLATGLTGCRSAYGTPTSVYGDGKYIAGGSSSGSAVAVAANLVSFALGTDTAGSIRAPAAFNGIFGYKPTKGTLSARGMVPACRSLDTAAIFTRFVQDARKVWYILDEYDSEDAYAKEPSSLPLGLADYRPLREAGLHFAVPPDSALEACTRAYRAAFASACQLLQSMGGRLIRLTDDAYRPFRIATELLYSGSLVSERIACIGHDFISQNLNKLHPATKSVFSGVLARNTKSWDVFSDQMAQAEATRQAARLFSQRHGKIEVLITPTVPCHPTAAEVQADPIALNARLGVFMHFANVLDLCAVSINVGRVDDGMPFGLQLVCASGMDGKLLDLAKELELEMGA
ncbi:amidase signature enzyme [Xylariaceae sp. FL0016]|nr:amidase signature enzyme [Xylariaceae sp. FL0016]